MSETLHTDVSHSLDDEVASVYDWDGDESVYRSIGFDSEAVKASPWLSLHNSLTVDFGSVGYLCITL